MICTGTSPVNIIPVIMEAQIKIFHFPGIEQTPFQSIELLSIMKAQFQTFESIELLGIIEAQFQTLSLP